MSEQEQFVKQFNESATDSSSHWYRTCQECGHEQYDTEPKGELTDAYRNRKCKKCKSEALDYGTTRCLNPEDEDWTS